MGSFRGEQYKAVWPGLLSIYTSAITQKKEVVIIKLDFEKVLSHVWKLKVLSKNGLAG